MPPFKLIDYIDRLHIIKETSSQLRLTCPSCEHNTLTINKNTGAYQCWGGCSTSQVRTALGVASGSTNYVSVRTPKSLKVVEPRLLELRRVGDYKPTLSEYTDHLETYYDYGLERRVIGHRYGIKGAPGYSKDFFPYIKRAGRWRVGRKGDGIWPPYRWSEAIASRAGNAVLFVEGESCADRCLEIGLCAITVQQWSREEISSALRGLYEHDLSVVYIADNDLPGIKKQELVCRLAAEVGVYVKTIPILGFDPDLPTGGDIADVIRVNSEYAKRRLFGMVEDNAVPKPKVMTMTEPITLLSEEKDENGNGHDWGATKYCLSSLRHNLIWSPNAAAWMYYEGGKYVVKPTEFVRGRVIAQLQNTDFQLSKNTIESVLYMLQGELVLMPNQLAKGKRYAVFKNATVDLSTLKIIKHSSSHNALMGASFAIREPDREDGGIIAEFLAEHMAEENLVWLRAFVNCIIRGDTHYEKYLELVGPGGSGKSTFTRILDAIVGAEGVLVSSLNALDKDKFEVACLHGKRLLLMPDQERYQGNYATLKAITGHDKLRFEVKGVQRNGNDFYANVFVVCTANEPLNGTDLTSGILRRRRVIGMVRSRISCDTLMGPDETGTLWPGLVDFWWWCIRMPHEEVDAEMTKQLVADENISDSPILGWALQSLERTACTVNNRVNIKALHKSYVKWCQVAAFEALRYVRFNHLLIDTLQHQLNWDVSTGIVNDEPFLQGVKFKEK